MAHMITVIQKSGKPILVNVEHIVTVASVAGATAIVLSLKDPKGENAIVRTSTSVEELTKLIQKKD